MSQLIRDCWPAEVFAPEVDAAPFRARVFITTDRIIAWREQGGLPVKAIDVPVPDPSALPDRNRGSFFGQVRFDTEAGAVHITAGGCKCGSTLNALSPPAPW